MTTDLLREMIQRGVQEQVKLIVEDAAQKAALEVQQKVRGMVGDVSCRVLDQLTFERYGTELRISVKIDTNKPKA